MAIKYLSTAILASSLVTLSAMASCPTGTDEIGTKGARSVCKLYGIYTNDIILTASNDWVLSGGVFIGQDLGSDPKNLSNGASSGIAIGSGVHLRRGTGITLHDTYVTRFNNSCLDIDDDSTINNNQTLIETTYLNCNIELTLDDDNLPVDTLFFSDSTNKAGNDGKLVGFKPMSGSPLLGAGLTPFDLWFDEADFIGAFGSMDWTASWTTSARN